MPVRALRALGVESAVTERAAHIPHQLICDHRGRLLSHIDLPTLWGDVGACVALHRADLHEVLLTSGEGVDGLHSTVRDLAFGPGAVRTRGQHALRFVTSCPAEVNTWTTLLGREATFLAVPIGRGQVYCYCDAPASVNTRSERQPATEYLAKLLADFAGPVPAILRTLGPDMKVHEGPIQEVVLNGWSRGSVVLIGDAAHATSPNMAEGAAMALEDGLVLAECLASEQSLSRALLRFEGRREPRCRWVRAQTHRRDRTRSLPPVVRNLVLRRWGRQIFHHNYGPLRKDP